MLEKIPLICIVAAFISGCATTLPVQTKTSIIEQPPLNVVNSEELGNTLLAYYITNTQPSIRTLENWGISSRRKNLPPQILKPIRIGEKIKMFASTRGDVPDLCYDSEDSVFFIPNGFGVCEFIIGKALINSGPVKVEPAEYFDVSASQFKQELIYNGKVGNSVKFLYREFSGDFMKAPFSQEVQYDLNDGAIIGFKGARIEILASSNRAIQYRVLKSFDR